MLIIAGASSSGKTTLSDYLTEIGYGHRIVTDTTREPRPGETDGVDYNFLSEKEFIKMMDDGKYAETMTYSRIESDGILKYVRYGSRISEYDETAIAVLTPGGIESIQKKGIHAKIVYLKVPKEDRIKMCLARGDMESEVIRRANSDEKDFEGFEDVADFVIENPGYQLSVKELANIVMKL